MRKIVIPGGTGQLGEALRRAFVACGDQVVILGRHARDGVVAWDGKSLGPWAAELDGADVVINLAGRTVNCRYTKDNLKQMMESRVDSTKVVGAAIAQCVKPPKLWLQMSTATIYAHRFDAANDEATGIIGGNEPDVPAYWAFSVEIGKAWEAAQANAETPATRKVALRSTMVMTPDRDGIFDVLVGLTRKGLGGAIGGGKQFISWIHETDFIAATNFLIDHEDIRGAVNLAAPTPLPQREFMNHLRAALGIRIGLPATKWMAEIGAFALRSDTELTLKSRRVVPQRLLDHGFNFAFPTWDIAATDLVASWRKQR